MNQYFNPNKKHHTRRGFRNNYIETIDKPLTEVIKWQIERLRAGLPRPALKPTPRCDPDLAFLKRNARAGHAMQPSATWIGHSTVLMQTNGLNIITDPVFSDRASPLPFIGPKRTQPPGIGLDELPELDVVVISHNHYDHLDDRAIKALATRHPNCLYLVPLGLARWFKKRGIDQVIELDWWESHAHRGSTFTLTPAQHWSSRSLGDRSKTLWGAWAVLGANFHWYFGGDSGYCGDFRDTHDFFASRQTPEVGGGFDLALLAIGAYDPRWFMREQHVEPSEAVRIHQDLGAKRSLAIHWGTFSLTDESLDAPPVDLAKALEDAALGNQTFMLLAIGATLVLSPRGGDAASEQALV